MATSQLTVRQVVFTDAASAVVRLRTGRSRRRRGVTDGVAVSRLVSEFGQLPRSAQRPDPDFVGGEFVMAEIYKAV